MGMKHFKPYTPSRRNMTVSTFQEVTKKTPEKSLLAKKRKNAGRNSYGRITVSTCGIVPKIKELADLKLQITLAISLHAPNDELRKTMMPIANKYSIAEIMDACRYYLDKTGRRISFEYSLVKGVNDTKECANELIELVKGLNCHINLIPVNPIKERDYEQSEKNSIKNFKDMLERKGINATVRREMGRDIDGACGQLRQNHIDENSAI